MASKRQTTMAKIAREQAVRERRARKLEKRDKKRAAALAKANPETAVVVDGGTAEGGPEATP
jgi:hypothetical protein